MAFYKTITVDGKEYEYNVGKHFIKIKGLGENPNIKKTDFFKDSRGDDGDLVVKQAVTPGMIADYINGTRIRDYSNINQCMCGKPHSDKTWRCDPYDAEILEEYRYAYWCDECYENRSMDI